MTVALPTISAAGIEAVGIPTALLSNHTAFPSWTFSDLTSEILPIVEKWDESDREFDAIYTGYLTTKQIKDVKKVFDLCSKSKIRFVDPAMADGGKLYAGFGVDHVIAMRSLLSKSDICKPNVTEACLLTSTTMISGPQEEKVYLALAKKIAALGPSTVIISGASTNENTLGCYLYHKGEAVGQLFEFKKEEGLYHGTGDLFASALISCIVNGKSEARSIAIAHQLVVASIAINLKEGIDGLRYGPVFEPALHILSQE